MQRDLLLFFLCQQTMRPLPMDPVIRFGTIYWMTVKEYRYRLMYCPFQMIWQRLHQMQIGLFTITTINLPSISEICAQVPHNLMNQMVLSFIVSKVGVRI